MAVTSDSLKFKWKINEVKLYDTVDPDDLGKKGFVKPGDIKIKLEDKYCFEITDTRFIEDKNNISDNVFRYASWEFDENTKILKLKHMLMKNVKRCYIIEETANQDELKFTPTLLTACGAYSGIEYFVVEKC